MELSQATIDRLVLLAQHEVGDESSEDPYDEGCDDGKAFLARDILDELKIGY